MVNLVNTLGVFHYNCVQLCFPRSSHKIYAPVVLDLVKQLYPLPPRDEFGLAAPRCAPLVFE